MQPDTKFCSPDELTALMKEARSPLEFKRLTAIRLLMAGSSRESVMEMFNISWSALQKWVRLWNKGGAELLKARKPTGRPSKMTPDVKDFIVRKIEFTSSQTGERITGLAISGTLKKIFGIKLKKSAIYWWLRRMGYRRLRPRELAIKRNEAKARHFKDNFKILYENLEVWDFDETGIEGDSPLRLIWSRRGVRPVCYYSGSHIHESLIGAVNPKSGGFECLIMPYNNTNTFQRFLDYFNDKLCGRHVLMVLDNASWHKTETLRWGTVLPIFLPPYSPDLNPIEVLWKVIKDRLYDEIPARDNEELQNRIQAEVRYFYANPQEIKSICKVNY